MSQYESQQQFGKAYVLGRAAPSGCPDIDSGSNGFKPKHIDVTRYRSPTDFFLAVCQGQEDHPVCASCKIRKATQRDNPLLIEI